MSAVDQFGVNGHFHISVVSGRELLVEIFKPEGSNDRGGTCSFAGYLSLEAALEELPRLKAENPQYTSWLIERLTPCVDISVAWRGQELPPAALGTGDP